MAKNPRQQIFAPVGRMNQDDSIITPTKNYAGRNAFSEGDYKYLLNARTGSSNSDNFGDVEVLKGTTEITSYKVRTQLFSNSEFLLNLTGWSQIAVNATPWSWYIGFGLGAARINAGGEDILYQAISLTAGKTYGLSLRIIDIGSTTTFTSIILYVKYLQGTTVLSSEVIWEMGDDVNASAQITIPANCDGIGFQCISTYSGSLPTFGIESARIYGWATGSRPAGTEKVVSRYENKEHKRLYYAVYNSSNNHCIRFYDQSENAVFELLKWSGLDFTSTRFVKMAMIDNWLAMTDRENGPRLMDVDTVSDMFNAIGSADFREFHIAFHKWGPVMPPVIKAYYDGSNDNYEKFENKVIQFAYRYIYKGRLKSRWSPISNSYAAQYRTGASTGDEITSIQIDIPGFTLDDPGAATEYNYFNNDDDKFTEAVESIDIAYRESSTDLWRLLTRHTVGADNTEFFFEGTSDGAPIPNDDFSQLFDTVPIKAGTVEAVDNRFVFADCLDEYDAAAIPVVTDVAVNSASTGGHSSLWWNKGRNTGNDADYTAMSTTDANEYGKRVMLNQTTFKGRGLYKLGIQWLAASGWRSAIYTCDDFMFEIPAEADVVEELYSFGFKLSPAFRPPDYAVAYQIMRTNCLNIDYFIFGSANSFTYLIDDTAAYADNTELPESIRDRIRQHFENARLVIGQDLSAYLPTLSGKPFFRSMLSDVRRTTTTTTLADASRIYIDINNWYNSSKKNSGGTQNNPINNLYYNYREGDRVRFLASTSAVPGAGDKEVYDMPILEFTGKGIIIEKPDDILWLPDDSGTDPDDYIIEVYTPKKPGVSDYVYHETGEWYPVLYPGTEQRDLSKRDWTYTDHAGITCETYGDIKVFNNRPFAYGDCHALAKVMYLDVKTSGLVGPQFWLPSMNPNVDATYDIWEKSNGRPAPAYTDLPVARFKTTQFRFGGQIVEESFVNQLNRFKDQDQKIFPSEYGRIRNVVVTANAQVESVGTILLAIGEREAFSIYVNRTTLEDLSGRSQVALSDRVLGSYNVLLGSHGTFNPESVSVHRGRVYYWDAANGTWVRYGRDGLTAISREYKMSTWFKSLAKLMIAEYGTDDEPTAICEISPFHDELITYNNHTDLPATFRDYSVYKGAAFSEDDKGWKYCHNYNPEMFGKLNDDIFSFKAGSIYLHEDSDTYRSFYGTSQDVKFEPVFNELPKDMKSWQAITIISSHKWSVERLLSEYRGAKTKQQSSIELADFEEVEDGYYAAIKMDMNTPLVSYPLINGNKMRSKAVRALLKLDPSITTLSLLHYVLMGEIDSPKNS